MRDEPHIHFIFISRCQQIHSVSIYLYYHNLYNECLVQICSYLSLVLEKRYIFPICLAIIFHCCFFSWYCFIVYIVSRHKLSNLILGIYWLAAKLVFLSCSVDTKSELHYWSITNDKGFPLLVLALECRTLMLYIWINMVIMGWSWTSNCKIWTVEMIKIIKCNWCILVL